MTVTVNTKAYTFDSNTTPNVGRHNGPAHTHAVKDVLDLKRTAPKPTATSDGVARSSAKFARSVTLANGSVSEARIEVNVDIPVGMADADITSLCDDGGDFIISAAGLDLVKKHKIVQ